MTLTRCHELYDRSEDITVAMERAYRTGRHVRYAKLKQARTRIYSVIPRSYWN